jgi:N-acetylglucosamine kinase-like BadF-type ATPase
VTDSPLPAVLALDGGSTKTDAVLVSADGAVLGRGRVGPSNHQLVGVDAAVEALGQALPAV